MESTRQNGTSRVARHAGKLAVLLLALLLASCSSDASPLEDLGSSADAREARPQPGEPVSFVVERAIDGDTVEIAGELHGTDTVRMIGVDTPESADPDRGAEPMGKEAAAFTETLGGRTVELVADEEPLDPYGRALSYVYLEDGTMFNASLLREGLAQVAIFPPNTAHADDLYRYQEEASAAGFTSGLAALGLGGVLGLSSMLTGIGVVIVAGVATYQLARWALGTNERELAKKREHMIQEVLKQHQKSMADLAQDIGEIAGRMEEYTARSDRNAERLARLKSELRMFKAALATLQDREENLENREKQFAT